MQRKRHQAMVLPSFFLLKWLNGPRYAWPMVTDCLMLSVASIKKIILQPITACAIREVRDDWAGAHIQKPAAACWHCGAQSQLPVFTE